MARLDLQKAPTRVHARKNKRYYVRGYATLPHEPWGDSKPAAGAAAGASTATVTSIAPTSITKATATTIAFTGTGYTAGTVILYRDLDGSTWIALPSITYTSATSISGSFNIPEAGSYEVAVQKAGEVLSGAKPLTVT